jgi:hypothetical protein
MAAPRWWVIVRISPIWYGWVYSWKLHLVTVVAAVWIPVAAELLAANQTDNEIAPRRWSGLPPETNFV